VALGNKNQDYGTLLSLSQPTQRELSWWGDHLSKWKGKSLKHQPYNSSDTSQLDWGAAYMQRAAQEGPGTVHAHQLFGTAAVIVAMKIFLKDASGISVLLQLDNATLP